MYWVLAARFYSAEMVGLSSAALSAMLLLSGISQLSLNSVLVRFVPQALQRVPVDPVFVSGQRDCGGRDQHHLLAGS